MSRMRDVIAAIRMPEIMIALVRRGFEQGLLECVLFGDTRWLCHVILVTHLDSA